MTRLRILIKIFLFLKVSYLSAQTNDLTQAQIDDFKEEASAQIERLQKNLEQLGSKGTSFNVKEHIHKETLKLFIENGKSYRDSNGIVQPPVYMQVSNVHTGTISNPTLDEYLRRLRNLNYAKVLITKAETHRITDLHKVGNDYHGAATIFQRFIAYDAEGRMTYTDVTIKTVKIIVRIEIDAWGEKWVVLLGNIDVVETTNL